MFQPFATNGVFEELETRDVAARTRQALDKATADRVGDSREYDWHRACHLLQQPQGRTATGKDDVWREGHQFRCVSASAVSISPAPTAVDPHVATDGPACLLQPL